MWRNHLMYGGLMWWFWLLMIAVIAGVVAVFWRVRPGAGGRTDNEAIHILERRYAEGHISKAEFDEKKRDLVHH